MSTRGARLDLAAHLAARRAELAEAKRRHRGQAAAYEAAREAVHDKLAAELEARRASAAAARRKPAPLDLFPDL